MWHLLGGEIALAPSYIMRWIKKAIFFFLIRPHERNTMCVNGKGQAENAEGAGAYYAGRASFFPFSTLVM